MRWGFKCESERSMSGKEEWNCFHFGENGWNYKRWLSLSHILPKANPKTDWDTNARQISISKWNNRNFGYSENFVPIIKNHRPYTLNMQNITDINFQKCKISQSPKNCDEIIQNHPFRVVSVRKFSYLFKTLNRIIYIFSFCRV